MSPLMLNTLHMPLVHYSYYSFALGLIDCFKELSVLFIHEDPFQFREVLLHRLNIPRILSLFYQFTSSGSKQVSAKVEAPNLWNFWIWSVLSK